MLHGNEKEEVSYIMNRKTALVTGCNYTVDGGRKKI